MALGVRVATGSATIGPRLWPSGVDDQVTPGDDAAVAHNQHQEQLDQVLALLKEVLGPNVVGAYLHGSTATGRLRPRSDLDVLAVARRATTHDEKERLVRGLFQVSSPSEAPGPVRPIELTIVVESEVRPWRYPPRFDFLYGEWLRRAFAAGNLEPWDTISPDLAALITMVLQTNRAVLGPPPAEVFDPVPASDLCRAVVAGIDGLMEDLADDTRNVILTLARIWLTVATGEVGSKDEAADWALPRLPDEHRAVLVRARAIYLGEEDERWEDLQLRVRPHADYIVGEIERLAAEGRA
jgi:predicted nucleotidyltransferase